MIFDVEGMVYSNIKVRSFTHPHIVSDLYDLSFDFHGTQTEIFHLVNLVQRSLSIRKVFPLFLWLYMLLQSSTWVLFTSLKWTYRDILYLI